jgi:hypothetical protein
MRLEDGDVQDLIEIICVVQVEEAVLPVSETDQMTRKRSL